MSKGGGSTTVQKADPWSGVKPYLESMYANVDQQLNNQLGYFPGQTYADFDPLQMIGMQGMLSQANNMMPSIEGYQGGLQGYMNAPLNITNDPAVQNMMDANRQQVTQALTEDWLPSISGDAAMAGQYGGSRQGIAEGQALGRAADALANANAQTALGAYGNAAKLAATGASLMPGAMQLGFMPSQTLMDVGGMLQGMDQQAINDAIQRYYYPEQKMWDTLGQAASIYSGAQPFGTSSTTGPGSSSAAGAIGGAMMGSQLLPAAASALAPAGMTLGSWALPSMQGIGSILGMLPFLSDRRVKTNIKPIGERDGHQWYTFEYKDPEKHGHGTFTGVMADEVEKIKPEAVTEIDGYKAVYYGML